MRTQRAIITALFVVVLAFPATAQSKSKVLGRWTQTEILLDGKPMERPSGIPRGASSAEFVLKISLKNQKVTVKTELFMPLPGQSPMMLESESITYDLGTPGRQRLIEGGPLYIATATLDERSFTVTFADDRSGELVKKQHWTIDETGSRLTAGSESPGAVSCLATREVDPTKPMPDAKTLAKDPDCKPARALLRIYKRS